MANTSFMQPDTPEPATQPETTTEPATTPDPEMHIDIDPLQVRKLRILALYQNTTPEELIRLAVDDFLALRNRQLQAAILALTSDESATKTT